MDKQALADLPVGEVWSKPAEFESTRRWLRSETYRKLQAHCNLDVRRANLTHEDVEKLTSKKFAKATRMPADYTPKGTCYFFTVAEMKKQVRRGVQHPAELNVSIPDEMCIKLAFHTRAERHAVTRSGRYCMAFDIKTCYDQTRLPPDVADFFCFWFDGAWYRLDVLSMGFRASCEVAHTEIQRLADIPGLPDSVRVECLIDNVRFVSDDREAALAAGAEFRRRCETCNVKLNDAELSLEEILAGTDERPFGEWLGEVHNYVTRKAWCTEQTLRKVIDAWDIRRRWTFRNFSAFVQLCFYCSSTLRLDRAKRFAALRAYRDASVIAQANPAAWDHPVAAYDFLSPGVLRDLEFWKDEVLLNGGADGKGAGGVDLLDPERPPDLHVMTDASDWGWCVIWCDDLTGAVRWFAQPWGQSLDRDSRQKSVYAEPEAVYRAFCVIGIRPDVRRVVRLATDSSAARWALDAGYSKAWRLNVIVHRILRDFPGVDLRPEHVAGLKNASDFGSRGKIAEMDDEEWRKFLTWLADGSSTVDPAQMDSLVQKLCQMRTGDDACLVWAGA